MYQAAISGTGLWVAPHTISNAELVTAYNAYVRQQNEDPDLAVFLRTMEFMRSSLGSSTTLVLPTSMPGMEWFRPDALKRMSNSGIPGLNFSNLPPVSDDPKGTAQAAQQEGTR